MATSNNIKKTRIEKDSLGSLEIPEESYYGIYTQRVLGNFQFTGQQMPHMFLQNYIRAKICYARVNKRVKKLDPKIADAIITAGNTLLNKPSKEFMQYFPIDVIQSGGGTSTNMMINEVLANIANEILGHEKGLYTPVHPNDHVNMSQSSNDTFPGVIKITSSMQLEELLKQLSSTIKILRKKSLAFRSITKVGRTHLQDAVKITVGDEFSAFAQTLEKNKKFLLAIKPFAKELSFGGTALGSLQNITKEIRKELIKEFSKEFTQPFTAPHNYFEATSSSSDMHKISSALSILAGDLSKIASDLRLLSSGPRGGLNELTLPPVQAGSSIMPGKVNPSILEALNQACFKVMGNHHTIELATVHAQLQLQAFMPIISVSLYESFVLLTQGLKMFEEKCLKDIQVNKYYVKKHFDSSFVYATDYAETLGYAKVAELVKKAYAEDVNLQDLINKYLKEKWSK